jgi:signal transduction histidine kinase
VDHVARSGHHLLELVNDILDLAKVEADRVVLERHPQRIEPVVADAIATVRPIASRRGVALNVNVGEDLPELSFDRTRMQQVLHNVLSNAIKFTDAGGSVTLTVARHAAGLSLRVSDTGVGIAPADMQKLFKPFVQVGAQRHGGTGLGLVLTRKLVELHGGRIDLESAFGIGTTLTITLPSVDDSSPAPSADR